MLGPVLDAQRHHHPFALAAAPGQRGLDQDAKQARIDDDFDRFDIAMDFDTACFQRRRLFGQNLIQ